MGSADAIAGLLLALKEDTSIDVRELAAISLASLTENISDEMNNVLLDLLKNTFYLSTIRDITRVIGRVGKGSEQNIQALYNGLLSANYEVRTTCVRGLVLLARRFPATYATIEKLFMQAIEQPEFDMPDNDIEWSAHDYAYDGLWLLVVGGEIEDEDE